MDIRKPEGKYIRRAINLKSLAKSRSHGKIFMRLSALTRKKQDGNKFKLI
jgi:hypothetical protein